MAPQIKYTQIFIDNKWVNAKSGKTFDTFNPHDGSVIAKVAEGDKADIDLAVSAARRAFHRNSEWRLMDASKRRELLNKFADLIARDADYLAELESSNNGMVLKLAKTIMHGVVGVARYLASLADKCHGDTIPADGELFGYTLKQPVGVCGLILPWNGPIFIFVNKVVTALAAGCTVVVKPAEQTPLTALVLASLLVEAGVPPGVVNVVPGFGVGAGTALTHHPDVAKISFTGSLEVDKLIQQAAGANNLKRVTLELGGKSPLVIMNDANLNKAVVLAGHAVFSHSGQICIAASRLYVQSGIYDKFVEKAVQHAKSIKVGNPAAPDTQQGPQTDEATLKKALEYIELGKKEGARLLTGGKRIGTSGYYIEPTVFTDVKDDMIIAKEEIFGPVQSILKFDTLDEVIDRANNTNYGLAAGIFTSNIETALHFTKHVEAGTVWSAADYDDQRRRQTVGYSHATIDRGEFRAGTSVTDVEIHQPPSPGWSNNPGIFELFEEESNNTIFEQFEEEFNDTINSQPELRKFSGVNTYLQIGPQSPFGGFKESGIGRENGKEGIEGYLEVKSVAISLPKKV